MKNIVLLSDGTGNSAAKQHKTNVWRLYEALDLSDPDKQIAFYDDGVGSQRSLPLRLLGNAFGLGLARNVKELYIALCRTYKNGDKIYLFGFSRGAFTVRMLAGLIDHCGLVQADDEAELRRKACRHFDTYRSRYRGGYLYRLLRFVRRLPLKLVRRPLKRSGAEPDERKEVCIEFIGAWDTVDAYGFPVYELVWLWDLLVWPSGSLTRNCPITFNAFVMRSPSTTREGHSCLCSGTRNQQRTTTINRNRTTLKVAEKTSTRMRNRQESNRSGSLEFTPMSVAATRETHSPW